MTQSSIGLNSSLRLICDEHEGKRPARTLALASEGFPSDLQMLLTLALDFLT